MGAERPRGITIPKADRAPDLPPPAPDHVHLWVANLDPASGAFPARFAATTDAERERASRFHRRDDGDRYLAAHGALRLLLASYLTCDPLGLRFAVNENGKPFLDGERVQFNLSHSGDLALIAVAWSRQVGVDVEQVRPMSDLESVAARVCTPVELATLAGLAQSERERAFFAMWTRKEALAKATGEGIGAIVRDARHAVGEGKDRWTVTEVGDLAGYAASVAAEGAGWALVRRDMTDTNGRR